MSIRRERDPMGMGGQAWYVTHPTDLARLPETAAALVPASVATMFRDVPASIGQLAKRAPLASMRRWIETLVEARCELEIYATKVFGREARLRFHVTPDFAPSFRGVTAAPSLAVPRIVEQIHAVTGHIDTQYGASGTLVALDALQTLDQLVAAHAVLNADELAIALKRRPRLRAFVGIFECDGDWLCTDPKGRTVWAGGEWVEAPFDEATDDVTCVLDGFFDALTAKKYFRPGL